MTEGGLETKDLFLFKNKSKAFEMSEAIVKVSLKTTKKKVYKLASRPALCQIPNGDQIL